MRTYTDDEINFAEHLRNKINDIIDITLLDYKLFRENRMPTPYEKAVTGRTNDNKASIIALWNISEFYNNKLPEDIAFKKAQQAAIDKIQNQINKI